MEFLPGKVYEAIPFFEDHLERELKNNGKESLTRWGPADGNRTSLYYLQGGQTGGAGGDSPPESAAQAAPVFWQRNVWRKPFRLEFASISRAASALRSIQRNWAPSLFTQFRRGALITEKLPPLRKKPLPFPWILPAAPMGAWTLLDEHTMIAGADCSSPFPGGVAEFEEDRSGPPSRAYLKLWEALTLAFPPGRAGALPGPGTKCLDAGASPGGWTWALARLGAAVCAVDRAPLENRIAALPGVSFIKHDAFTLKPEDIGPIDWLFCDAACYPPRLFRWIEKWLASGLCKNYVCTIKMQGAVDSADFVTPRLFADIPDSRVIHLYYNKHELSWIKTAQ